MIIQNDKELIKTFQSRNILHSVDFSFNILIVIYSSCYFILVPQTNLIKSDLTRETKSLDRKAARKI